MASADKIKELGLHGKVLNTFDLNQYEEDTSLELYQQLQQQIDEINTRLDQVVEQVNQISEKVQLKDGASLPRGKLSKGSKFAVKNLITLMKRPQALAQLGLRQALLKAGVSSVKIMGLMFLINIAVNEAVKAAVIKEARRVLAEYEAEQKQKRKEVINEAIAEVERKRREAYRSIVG